MKYLILASLLSIPALSIAQQSHAVPVAVENMAVKANAAQRFSGDTTRLKVGDKCPDLVFRDSARKDVKISSLKGKYILIDVWASWCYPCRMQQPHLQVLEEKMKDKNIVFLGISVDTQEFRWRGPQLAKMGGVQWMAKDLTFNYAFGVNAIPRYILLDKKGVVVNLNMPLPSHPELEQELLKLKGI